MRSSSSGRKSKGSRIATEGLRRAIDVVVASVALLLLLPLFLVIWLAIIVDSPGPAIFRQKRLGKHGREFWIFKFRTMIVDAEKQGSGVYTYEGDPRITRVGRILRESSLDELPQLWNVLKGDMSLIGPRPPVVYHPYRFEEYPENVRKRFEVRPGITGYAQVVGRNSISWDERLQLDAWYVENRNWRLDLWILWRTVFEARNREKIVRARKEREKECGGEGVDARNRE